MNLLTMSLSASVLIVTILMVRQLFIEKLPKLTFIALWIVVLIRLLVPYSLPSHLCLYNMAHTTHYEKTENADNFAMQPTTPLSFTKQQAESNTAKPLTIDFKTIGFILWVIGLCGMTFYYIIKYKRSMNYFSDSIDYTDPYIENWRRSHKLKRTLHIRLCDTIHSPLTYRILSPVILFPMSFDFEDRQTLNFVLEHEYQHIKHFDQLFKYLMIVATCIHWFNPFVWLMFFISNRDIEARCDESVLYHLGIKQKKDYATTLLTLETNRYNDKKLYVHFSMEPLEERILLIMKNKKFGKITLLCSFILLGTISIALATTQKVEKPVEILSFGNRPLYLDDMPLTSDNSTVVYETTLENATTLNDQFTYSTDGIFDEYWATNSPHDYLWLFVDHNEAEPLPITIDKYVKTEQGLESQGACTSYTPNADFYSENSNDPNEPFGPSIGDGLAPGQDYVFNIKIDENNNKPINASIKLVVIDKEAAAQLNS